MTFTLTIDCDNAAFCGDANTVGDGGALGDELARALERLARHLRRFALPGDEGMILDFNGNKVGKWGIA